MPNPVSSYPARLIMLDGMPRATTLPAAWSPAALVAIPSAPQALAQALRADPAPAVVVLPDPVLADPAWTEVLREVRRGAAILGLGEPGQREVDEADCYVAESAWLEGSMVGATLDALAALARARLHAVGAAGDLARLNQRLRVLDQIPEAIVGTDLNGIIRSWNQSAERLFGYRRDQALGEPLDFVFEMAPGEALNLHKLLEPLLINNHHVVEHDVRRPDGSTVPINLTLSLEKNAHGDIVGVICCCRDISKRRRAEGERRSAFQRLTFFIERMPLGFIEWDSEGNIRAWNHAAEVIFGYSQREAIGRPFTLLIEECFYEDCRDLFCQMSEQLGGYRSCNANLTKDGQRITCEWNNSPLIDEQGDVVGFASIVADITERIRTQEELTRSKDAAQAANRSKDEFLAVMSHEVRTPMNSIIGFADLLLDTLEDESQTELVNIIKANAFNLLELISNVLNYSRLEAGKVKLKEQDTDLATLLHEVEEVVSAEAREKGLGFETEIDPDAPPVVQADYMELRQVLLNLVTNAVKFTHEGGVRVTVRAERLATAPGDRWELLFAVHDTGEGIREEDKPKLFQSFTQLDSSSTRRFGGTGLGLAICRRLVELWGGRIWADPNEGGGAVFRFTLRARESISVSPAVGARNLYEEIDDERFAEIFPMDLLLISPDPGTREILGRVFANLGYALHAEHEAIDGISYLQDHACDLVLLDNRSEDFAPEEMATLLVSGQAGQDNRSARLVILSEKSPGSKGEDGDGSAQFEKLGKPIIARQARQLLRRLAVESEG